MIIIGTICSLILLILLILFYLHQQNKKALFQKKKDLQKSFQNLEQQFDLLINNYDSKAKNLEKIDEEIKDKKKDLEFLKQSYTREKNIYDDLKNNIAVTRKEADELYQKQKKIIEQRLEDFKKITHESANNYVDNIEKAYEHAEAVHIQKMTRLQEELNGAAADLQKLKDTRKAAHQALLKEREVKENKDNYCLIPSSLELQDIHTLQHIKNNLHKPRILAMLIWQTFWQPIAKEKFPIILQDKTKMGIYKITNLETDQCYIGQSVDVYKRFCDHCKAGLGIDTPVGNKLYKAMQEYGLQNFSFELLCECSKQQLDEKEKYFIQLYQADLYGYNGTKGNK